MGRSGRERQVCGRSRETAEVDRAYLNKTGSVGLRATDTADEGKAWIQKFECQAAKNVALSEK